MAENSNIIVWSANGHYYQYFSENLSWDNANTKAKESVHNSKNGYLATITEQGENDFIESSRIYYGYEQGGPYLGGTDREVEGKWKWENGELWNYDNWLENPKQPDNQDNEDYLQIYGKDSAYQEGKWNDVNGGKPGGYIVEWGSHDGAEYIISKAPITSDGSRVINEDGSEGITFSLNFDTEIPKDLIGTDTKSPVIGIPLNFIGNTGTPNVDFTVEVSGDAEGKNYYEDGILYTAGTKEKKLDITVTPINNSSWDGGLRNVSIEIAPLVDSQNIYKFEDSVQSKKVFNLGYFIDDEAQLSLGQGAKKSIYLNIDNKPDLNASLKENLHVFDTDGIDETTQTFSDNGLINNFSTRWKTYLYIPSNGAYRFNLTGSDAISFSAKDPDTGESIFSKSDWKSSATRTISTDLINLNKGTVLEIYIDTWYGDEHSPEITLSWDRNDENSTEQLSGEPISGSYMFLSKEAALIANPSSDGISSLTNKSISEPNSYPNTSDAFYVFSNKDASIENVALTFKELTSSETATFGNDLAVFETTSTNLFDDYRLNLNGSQIDSLPTNPSTKSFKDNNPQIYSVDVLSDSWAEKDEAITLSLKPSSGYGIKSLDGTTNKDIYSTVYIKDSGPFLSISNYEDGGVLGEISEGEIGKFRIQLKDSDGNDFTYGADQGQYLRFKYQISTNANETTALEGKDFYAPKAYMNTEDHSTIDYYGYLANGLSYTDLYITAIEDSVREGTEKVTIEIVDLEEVSKDKDGKVTGNFARYKVNQNASKATLNIKDKENNNVLAYSPNLYITPTHRTGLDVIRAKKIYSNEQQATFDVRISSQPLGNITVTLETDSGNLTLPSSALSSGTLTFTPDNWDKPQGIILRGINTDITSKTTVTALAVSEDDSFYDGLSFKQTIVPLESSENQLITLWEGGRSTPDLATASVKSYDGKEGSTHWFGFEIYLSKPRTTDTAIAFRLDPGEGFYLDGVNADVESYLPTKNKLGQYEVIIPANQSSIELRLHPIDDSVAEQTNGQPYEELTLKLIDLGKAYTLPSKSYKATAKLYDNDTAETSVLAFTARGESSSDHWTTTSQLVVSEDDPSNGSFTPFGLTLASKPTSNVTLELVENSYQTGEIEVINPAGSYGDPITLTFTPDNWNKVQQLQVRGVNNNLIDGDTKNLIYFNTISDDPFYKTSNLGPVAVSVLKLDNDSINYSSSEPYQSDNDDNSPIATVAVASLIKNDYGSQTYISEKHKTSAKFNVELSKRTDQDTLIFLETNKWLTTVSKDDLNFGVSDDSDYLWGLRRFSSSNIYGDISTVETSTIDLDAINEKTDTFTANSLSGDFSNTWSGYLYIPKSGTYTLTSKVNGGLTLTLDGEKVIDKYYDTSGTWTTENLFLQKGDFVDIKVDYRSFTTNSPSVDLQWTRPEDIGSDYTTEIIPSKYFSRANGIAIVIPKNRLSSQITLQAIDDDIAERHESLTFDVLKSRGVDIEVVSQSKTLNDHTILGLGLSRTDRESVTLPAGHVLKLGSANAKTSDNTNYASFKLFNETTLYKDRNENVLGELTWITEEQKLLNSSLLIGSISSFETSPYEVLDPSVNIEQSAQLSINRFDGDRTIYTTSLTFLEEVTQTINGKTSTSKTNRENITLKKDTQLKFDTTNDPNTANTYTLKLLEDHTFKKGETINDIEVTADNVSKNLVLTNVNSGLQAVYAPSETQLVIIDNDIAGIEFSLDQGFTQTFDNSQFTLSEGGSSSSSTRYLKLTSQPTDTVIVYLETSDKEAALLQNSDSAVSSSRIGITFTPENWSKAQSFDVVVVDDNKIDIAELVSIHSLAMSSDPFYDRTFHAPLPFLIKNNDKANLNIELSQETITEASNTKLYLSLTSQPDHNVLVKLNPSDFQFSFNDKSPGRAETIKFTKDNWDVIQEVEVKAYDDRFVEDITRSTIDFKTTSLDLHYHALNVDSLPVVIVDDDIPQASIASIRDSAEESKPGQFQISLDSPTDSSEGSTGLVVNYEITHLNVASNVKYGSNVNNNSPSAITSIAQTPSQTGSIRIAPGQTSSDIFVVPIDDFVADRHDKQFTVSLTSGEGYSLKKLGPRNSATTHIINNDEAGIFISLAGEAVRVSENSGQNGTYALSLLSQPSHNVKVNLKEIVSSSGTEHLKSYGIDKNLLLTDIVFDASNWYIPQEITIAGVDDFIIEDGAPGTKFENTGIHPAQFQYEFSSLDPSYNSSLHLADHFTNTIQDVEVVDFQLSDKTGTQIGNALTSLQEGLDNLSLPLLGSIKGKTGDGLRAYIDDLVTAINAIGEITPKKLSEILTTYINNATGSNVTAEVVMGEIKDEKDGFIKLNLTTGDIYDIGSVDLDSNFGLPGLGFQSEGSIGASFNYDLGLSIVFPRTGSVYIDTTYDEKTKTGSTYFNADFKGTLSDPFSMESGLGFIDLQAANQQITNSEILNVLTDEASNIWSQNLKNIEGGYETGFSTDLDVFLKGDENNKLNASYIATAIEDPSVLETLFKYDLSGGALMSFGVTSGINNSSAFPSLSFDLSSSLPIFDYSNTEDASSTDSSKNTKIYFDDIKLEMGSFINNMLSPIVDGVDDMLTPLYPIVDALYADTKVFKKLGIDKTFDADKDGHVSPLDLANWFAHELANVSKDNDAKTLEDGLEATTKFLDNVKGVMDLVKKLEVMSQNGDFFVDFGSYKFETNPADSTDVATQKENDSSNKFDDTGIKTDTKSQANNGGASESTPTEEQKATQSNFVDIMSQLNELGFEFPILNNPSIAIDLLLGNAKADDLFKWTMPGMSFNSSIEKSFPIMEPSIEGVIQGDLNADATISFGFDASGLQEWSEGGFALEDSWKVFDGFYVNDWKDGVDINEFNLTAGMDAGLGVSAVVVRSDITGGLLAEASLDLLDDGEVSGTSDGKIRGEYIISQIDNPLNLFELIGDLSAVLKAKVEMGIDVGFAESWETIWEETLATIPIFEFGIGGSYGSGTISNDYFVGTNVFFDGNLNGKIDSIEPYAKTGNDASFDFRIDNKTFDSNQNGTIDPSEGRLMAYGGKDSKSGIELLIPLLAPLKSQMITPITTLHTFAQYDTNLSLSDEEIKVWINEAFQLKTFDYLNQDSALLLSNADDLTNEGALSDYVGHSKVLFGLDVLIITLQNLLPNEISQDVQNEFKIIESFSNALFEQSSSAPLENLLYNAVKNSVNTLYPNASTDLKANMSQVSEVTANASYEFIKRIDKIVDNAKSTNKTTSELIQEISTLKTEAFNFYRNANLKISEGLYLDNETQTYKELFNKKISEFNGDFLQLTGNLGSSQKIGNTYKPGIISSLGGNEKNSSLFVTENSTLVHTFKSKKLVSWSLNGGDDSSKFTINENTGELTFITPPDFENPTDNNLDNIYSVNVRATDAYGNYSEHLTNVDVTDGVSTGEKSSKLIDHNGKSHTFLFSGGELSDSETITVNTPFLNTNSEKSITSSSISLSNTAIDFWLDVKKENSATGSSASVVFDTDLVAQNLSVKDNNNQRVKSKKWGYFALDSLGNISDLSFDSLKNAGARFYDLIGNDGVADTVHLILVDGGLGDKDGVVNGVIDDPSTAGTVDIEFAFNKVGSDNIQLALKDSRTTGNSANNIINIKIDAKTLTTTSDEIGYIILTENEQITTDIIKQKGQKLITTLENKDVTKIEGQDDLLFNQILVSNEDNITFYKVKDGSLSDVISTTDSNFNFLKIDSFTTNTASLSSEDGLKLTLTESVVDQDINAFVGKHQSKAPIFDFSSIPESVMETMTTKVSLSREANYDTEIGFYKIVDINGGVRDPLTGILVSTDSEQYSQTALSADNLVNNLSKLIVEDNKSIVNTFTMNESSLIAPYATVNNETTYFAFGAANSDNFDHFKSLGQNLIGFEDIHGGGDKDYDDMIIKIDINS